MARARLPYVAAYEASLTIAARHAGVAREELQFPRGKRPRRQHGKVRQTAIYLAAVAFGVPTCELARLAGVDHRAIGRSVSRMELARDDSQIDRELDNLELELMA